MNAERIRLRQVAMFAEAARRGITRKMLQIDGGFSEATVRSWADGTHEMPLHAFVRMAESGALPLDLLSILLDDGLELVRAGAGVDLHALAASAADFVGDFAASAHPASEAGCAIGPNEEQRLNMGARELRAVGGAV